jgi:EpsI family protein
LKPIDNGATPKPQKPDAMKQPIKNLVLMLLMLASAGLGVILRPTISIADELPPIDLTTMVPKAFGSWHEDLYVSAQIIDPQQKQMLDKIYDKTLTRTYVNTQGYRIMLSIAYGKNQSGTLQLHKPETCYPAQGFSLLSTQSGKLDLLGKPIPASRLETSLGQRFEPITYWTVVGDHVSSSMTDKRITEVRYAMRGRIPDGMLVRISSIDKNSNNAYTIQSQFANNMIEAMMPEHRIRFAGTATID